MNLDLNFYQNSTTYKFLEELKNSIANILGKPINSIEFSEILGFNRRFIINKLYRIRKGSSENFKFRAFLKLKEQVINLLDRRITKEIIFILEDYEDYLKTFKDIDISSSISKNYHPFLKEDYFEIINTKEKAYWLGFIYADGAIIKTRNKDRNNKYSYRIKINQNRKDKILIYRFARTIGLNIKQISHYKKTDSYNLSFRNHKITKDLINMGVFPRKSKTIQLPYLSGRKLYLAFLLGYFDGDGETGTSRIFSGSKRFLTQIKACFLIENKIGTDERENGICYKLSLGMNLFREMLENYSRSLKRKRIS